jgi:leucine dehydrogenase
MEIFEMMAEHGHEQVVFSHEPTSGYKGIIAIHDTTLGPALGGTRFWKYGSDAEAIIDALRLSRGMTYKAAVAGLNLGGGKAVIIGDPKMAQREMLFRAHGRFVDSLKGRYITAEDVGTTPEDMATAFECTRYAVGLPPELGGYGDPSPLTARGVEAAIGACLRSRFGNPSPRGRAICVIGLGHVGLGLANRLSAAGAELLVTDIDEGKRRAAEALGARWIDPAEAIGAECDVLAPCALGGAIDAESVGRLRCEIVCGAANNVLADPAAADEMAERGVLYLPDFIANAGGLINVYAELHGLSEEHVAELVEGIGAAAERVLAQAAERGTTPLDAARAIAQRRLNSAMAEPRPARLTA